MNSKGTTDLRRSSCSLSMTLNWLTSTQNTAAIGVTRGASRKRVTKARTARSNLTTLRARAGVKGRLQWAF
jgi:hypothetical protein